jgi:outer membrane protein assembly factor BamB
LKKQTSLLIALGLSAIIISSSLAIYENSILNPDGSHAAWERSIPNFATALTTDDDKVFTMDISDNVNAYDQKTGASIWNGSSVGGYFAKGLIVAEDKVYGGYRYASVGCLDELTGQLLWNRMYTAGSTQAPDNLIVKDGRLFVVAEGPSAGVTAFNASSGDLLWQTPYRYDIYGNITDYKSWWTAGYPLEGDPFDGNSVYALGGNQSNVYIFKLDTSNGTVLWQTTSFTLTAIPSVITTFNGQVIIENGNQFESLNQTNGDNLWHISINAASIYSPVANEDVLFFGASDGNFYAINPSSGNISVTTKVDGRNLLANTNNYTPVVYPIQIDQNKHRIYWSFGFNLPEQYNGILVSLDSTTCSLVWTKRIQDNNLGFDSQAGLVINKDTVFLTENNALWVFTSSNGNLARNQHFDHYVSTPISTNEEVFVASDLQLRAYK